MARTEAFSIRRRVFALAISLLVGGGLVLLVFLQGYARHAADRAFDRLLAASALTIAGAVQVDETGVSVELPVAALAMLGDSERIFYSVRDAGGSLVTGYGDLDASMPPAGSALPVFDDLRYRGDSLRMATAGRLLSEGGSAGWVTIRVAETRGARRELAGEIFHRSAGPLLAIVAAALALLWFGVQRAFAPLALIERELRGRAPDALQPIAAPVPREVLQLAEALNAFMARLRGAMGSLQGLVADAAHQLRTPLASLRAQAEVMSEETDPARLRERAARIHANASHLSQLIHQLLMEATIHHRLDAQSRASVSVVEIVDDTRRRLGPEDAARLRVAIAPSAHGRRVRGDTVALREMLRNLVDNALRYAPDGDVEVTAESLPGGRVQLTVADRGPGIPEDERDAVLTRFHRGRNSQGLAGSGLGLAIVRHVVDAHQGQLALRSRAGGGLAVTVSLPVAPPDAGGVPLGALAMAVIVTLGAWFAPPAAEAQTTGIEQAVRYEAPQANLLRRVITVAGPTDGDVFGELARAFQATWPDVTVVYREMNGLELYREVVAGRLPDVDVLVSSAVDLQVRLANDGYALSHVSRHAADLPAWARWRAEVFGFTFEPVVIAYNPRRFTPETVPRSRRALLRMLEDHPAELYDRVGSYDIAQSSLGYLLASQDALVSSDFWGLANALGRVGVHLHGETSAILDEIEAGHIDLGYNVLGSYALARQAAGRSVGVVLPQDYMTVLSRSALILRSAPNPELGRAFVDWLLSPAGQAAVAGRAALGAIMPGTPGPWTSEAVLARPHGIVQPLAFGPALTVGLDRLRLGRFIQNWKRLVTDTPARPPGNP